MAVLRSLCLHHAERPAVARCPSCGESFCRECVVEHEFRLICAGCLEKIVRARGTKTGRSRLPLAPLVQGAVAVTVAAWTFARFAHLLSELPSDFHEGIVWQPDAKKKKPPAP